MLRFADGPRAPALNRLIRLTRRLCLLRRRSRSFNSANLRDHLCVRLFKRSSSARRRGGRPSLCGRGRFGRMRRICFERGNGRLRRLAGRHFKSGFGALDQSLDLAPVGRKSRQPDRQPTTRVRGDELVAQTSQCTARCARPFARQIDEQHGRAVEGDEVEPAQIEFEKIVRGGERAFARRRVLCFVRRGGDERERAVCARLYVCARGIEQAHEVVNLCADGGRVERDGAAARFHAPEQGFEACAQFGGRGGEREIVVCAELERGLTLRRVVRVKEQDERQRMRLRRGAQLRGERETIKARLRSCAVAQLDEQ